MSDSLYFFFDDPHMAELSQIVDFTPDELAKNRRGYLSERQIERMAEKISQQSMIVASVMLLPGLFFLMVTLLIPNKLPFLFMVAWVTIMILILKTQKTTVAQMLREPIVSAESTHLDADSSTVTSSLFGPCLITDTGTRVRVPPYLLDRMEMGRVYQVYVVNSRLHRNRVSQYGVFSLLSLEPTRQWAAIYQEKTKKKHKPKNGF